MSDKVINLKLCGIFIEVVKIKTIFLMLFLCGILSGFFSSCLSEQPRKRSSSNTEEHHLLDEDGEHSESVSDLEAQKAAIRAAQERQIEEGQRVVDRNIQYLEELERNNKIVHQNRETETEANEPPVNGDRIKKLQKTAKDRHFEHLEKLLK